jgi:ankyrin repeat protein
MSTQLLGMKSETNQTNLQQKMKEQLSNGYFHRNYNLEKIMQLVQQGADSNFADKDGDSILHMACINNRIDIIQELLKHGARLNQKNNDGDTPLELARFLKIQNVVEFLEQYIKENS